MSMPPLFIVNPASGGGRTRKRIPRLESAIAARGMTPDVQVTERRGHAYELSRRAIGQGRTCLVACGGDGTVYEVANAILDAGAGEDVVIGTVGLGTGKDVAKCLGIGRPASALRAISDGHERRIDVGRISLRDEDGQPVTRHFLLEASAGWVPEISQSTPRTLKRLGDTAPYVIMTVVKMAGRMGRDFTVEIDGDQFDGRYNTVSVHNMEFWGGDLLAVPGAAPDDGLLDVVRWGDVSRRDILRAVDAQRKANGAHLDMPGVDHHRARSISLSSPRASVVDLDGERGGYLPAHVEVVSAALRFLAPPAAPR